jgi:magnesium transporter
MLTVFRKRHPAVGSRPGTLVVPAEAQPPRIQVIHYDRDGVDEKTAADAAEVKALLGRPGVTWIEVQGVGHEPTLRALGEVFEIHPLALEDVVNTPQRPKIEAYPKHQLIITRVLRIEGTVGLRAEQVSIFVGPDYVLSFQEHYGATLDPVKTRVHEGKGPIREAGADYLAYAILDTIVDGYYPVIEDLGEALARLEERIMARPGPKSLDRLNQIKSSLASCHRGILPQREALGHLVREGSTFVTPNVRVYLRDTLDHCAQLVDVVDTNRDLANGLVNTYLSLVGARTNEVMKVLTIMSSVFIPLTFVAGVYGMNFEIPELHWTYGYPAALAVMAACAGWMLLYFKRKGWLGEGDDRAADDRE